MTVVEAITKKIIGLPRKAQEEVLQIVEQIEDEYTRDSRSEVELPAKGRHVLDRIADLAVDVGVDDLAERHHFYSHKRPEGLLP